MTLYCVSCGCSQTLRAIPASLARCHCGGGGFSTTSPTMPFACGRSQMVTEDPTWQSKQAPALPIPVFNVICICGRHVYATSSDDTWMCRGCDEKSSKCYCPTTLEMA